MRSGSRLLLGIYVCVSLAVILPLVLTEHPPLHDYYHWMFVGHLVPQLLTAAPDPAFAAIYELDPGLPPNAAAPLGIGLLAMWVPAVTAARIFGVLSALGFALAYAYLVRTIQRRPTVLEFAGFFWTNGYFMYNGYLSGLFALAPVFVAVACLHRALSRDDGPPPIHLAVLTLLGTAAYVGHVLAWVIVAAAIAVGCTWLLRRRRFKATLLLAATQLPSAALLLWYVLTRSQGSRLTLYEGWAYKAEQLIVPVALFFRVDPFPSVVPVLLANAVLALGLVVLALGQLVWPRATLVSWLVAATSGLVLLAGIATPFRQVGQAFHPDSRLILPGMLLLFASLCWRELGSRRALAVAVAAVLVSGAHLAQFRRGSAGLADIRSTLEQHLAPGVSLFFLRVYSSRLRGACSPKLGIPFGTDAAKWFDLERVSETSSIGARLMQTSVVRNRPGAVVKHWVETVDSDDLAQRDLRRRLQSRAAHFEATALVGCPQDVAALRDALGADYQIVAQRDWITLLRPATSP